MTKLSLVTYRELSKVAELAGFHWARQVGSHNTFRDSEGHIVVIPDHGSHVIIRPLLRKILRDMGLTTEEYRQLLKRL